MDHQLTSEEQRQSQRRSQIPQSKNLSGQQRSQPESSSLAADTAVESDTLALPPLKRQKRLNEIPHDSELKDDHDCLPSAHLPHNNEGTQIAPKRIRPASQSPNQPANNRRSSDSIDALPTSPSSQPPNSEADSYVPLTPAAASKGASEATPPTSSQHGMSSAASSVSSFPSVPPAPPSTPASFVGSGSFSKVEGVDVVVRYNVGSATIGKPDIPPLPLTYNGQNNEDDDDYGDDDDDGYWDAAAKAAHDRKQHQAATPNFQDMATPLPCDNNKMSASRNPYDTAMAEAPTHRASGGHHSPTDIPPYSYSSATTGHKSSSYARKKHGPKQKKDDTDSDFESWNVGPRYELLRILGRGSYGEVAQARDLHIPDKQQHHFVAIKRITSAFEQEVDAIRLFRETHILRRLKGHECIIQLLDIVPPPSSNKKKAKQKLENPLEDFRDLYLVFEYVDTDLYKLIMSPQYLTTEHIQTFLYQMLTGLKYIHSSSVIHRDLKPANILLNEDCSLKICDFGLARIVNSAVMPPVAGGVDDGTSGDSSLPSINGGPPKTVPPKPGLTRQLTKHVVTRWYRAPELILIQPYTSAVDIWSLGCILAELLSMQEGSVPGYQDRVPLFPGGSCYPLSGEGASMKSNERLDQLSVIFGVIGTPSADDIASIGKANEYIKSLKKKKGLPLESLYPAADPAAIDLLKSMLQFNPRKRCTANEALEHVFFKGVRSQDMERSADQPLIGPEFLESSIIDIAELKQRTYEEVMWYNNRGKIDDEEKVQES